MAPWTCATKRCSRRTRTASVPELPRGRSCSAAWRRGTSARPGCETRTSCSTPTGRHISYIENNKPYFTLTNAGLGFFEKAHWAVWTMDLSDYTNIEQIGNIFWYNAGQPNIILGHHAGQIVRDEAKGRWIVVVSSWGDFGPQGGDGALTPGVITPNPANPPVDILYDERPLSVNLLSGVHILEGKKHPVNAEPFPTEGKWDPGLTRINGRWHMSYVIALDLFSDFQPALARSPLGADHKSNNLQF